MDDLLPRADISGSINGELLGKLTSANWKERKEGLGEVEGLLAAAGGRIQPCVSSLVACDVLKGVCSHWQARQACDWRGGWPGTHQTTLHHTPTPTPTAQVGDLMPALKGRFTDTNKNLAAQALTVLAALARAMGRPIAREARPILSPAIKCICDSKSYVRVCTTAVLQGHCVWGSRHGSTQHPKNSSPHSHAQHAAAAAALAGACCRD
jgi:hypothetical protein